MDSAFLILLLLLNLQAAPAWAQESQDKLRIIVVEGEGAINNVKLRVNREVVVEVDDENRKPVAGAAVAFRLPNQGPSGVFPTGSKSLTTTTDGQGRAAANGIRVNNQIGRMEIRVTASYQSQTTSALITQTNVAGQAAPGGMSSTTKWLIVAAAVGGAAAIGVVAGTRGGGSSSSSSSTGIIITPGTPTVGGPK